MARGMLATALILGLAGAASAWATTVDTAGFHATATATVAPTRLPKQGAAPVRLTITATGTRSDPSTPPTYPMRSVDVRLDPQISVDTRGLATCTATELRAATPAAARRKCGDALIGSGREEISEESADELGTFHARFDLLFFNARQGRRPAVLMYRSYTRIPQGIAWLIGNGRDLRIKDVGDEDSRVLTDSIQIRIGKTWRYKGTLHSYLNGRCARGTIRNAVALELDGGTVTKTVPQRCRRAARS